MAISPKRRRRWSAHSRAPAPRWCTRGEPPSPVDVEVEVGAYETGVALLAEATFLYEQLDAVLQHSQCLANLAEISARLGDDIAALRHEPDALRLRSELGSLDGIAFSLIGAGRIAQRRGAPASAVEVSAGGTRVLDDCGTTLFPSDETLLEASLVDLRTQLGPLEFREHWMTGRDREIDALISQAMMIR